MDGYLVVSGLGFIWFIGTMIAVNKWRPARNEFISATMASFLLSFMTMVIPLCIRASDKHIERVRVQSRAAWSRVVEHKENLHVDKFSVCGESTRFPHYYVTYAEDPTRVDEVSCVVTDDLVACERVKTLGH